MALLRLRLRALREANLLRQVKHQSPGSVAFFFYAVVARPGVSCERVEDDGVGARAGLDLEVLHVLKNLEGAVRCS